MTLAEIIESIRRLLDEPEAEFWTDDELLQYVNDAYVHYWQWLIRARDPGTFKRVKLQITSGEEEVTLPDDFVEVRLAELNFGRTTFPIEYRPRFNDGLNEFDGFTYYQRYTYDIIGDKILELNPRPNFTATEGLVLTYVFEPEFLESSDPLPSFKNMYRNLIVWKACIYAKTKEESGADIAKFQDNLDRLEKEFKETIETASMQRIYSQQHYVRGYSYYTY